VNKLETGSLLMFSYSGLFCCYIYL